MGEALILASFYKTHTESSKIDVKSEERRDHCLGGEFNGEHLSCLSLVEFESSGSGIMKVMKHIGGSFGAVIFDLYPAFYLYIQ